MPDQHINIAEWLTQPYVDAVPWREAADGDLVLLRDPSSRGLANADAYVLDGVPTFNEQGNLVCYSRRVQGEPTLTWSYRKAANRVFSGECFQVWRNWRRDITASANEINIDDHAGSDITIRRDPDGPSYTVCVDNGYAGERGVDASITLTPDQMMAIVNWLQQR